MAYNAVYSTLRARALANDTRTTLPDLTTPLGAGALRFFLARQTNYLSWTLALILMQLFEVLVLAWGHFIFLPPTSLKLLRILSALNLMGALAALVIRSRNASVRNEKSLLLLICRLLFCVTAAGSIALLLAFLFLTDLHRSSPPLLRAVILSGIFALPFDTASVFLLYNSSRIRTGGLRLAFRLPTIAVYLSSLVPLYFDMPLLYLVLKLAPHFALTLYLWAALSGETIKDFFLRPVPRTEERPELRRFLTALVKPLALALMFETAFLLLFTPLGRLESNIAVILYIAHKAIHAVTILGIKIDFLILRRMKRAAVLNDSRSLNRILAFFFLGSATYAAVVLALVSPLFAQRAGLFWRSAAGDYLNFSAPMLVMLAVLVWLRASALGLACVPALSPVKNKLFFLTLLFALAPSAYIFTSGAFVYDRYDAEQVLMYLLAVDLLSALAACSALISGLSFAGRRTTAESTLENLLAASASEGGGLLFISLWPEVPAEFLSSADGVHSLLQEDDLVAPWGKSCAFVLTRGSDRQKRLKLVLLERFGSLIRELRDSPEGLRQPAEILSRLFPGPLSPAEALYQAALDRSYLQRAPKIDGDGAAPASGLVALDLHDAAWHQLSDPLQREAVMSYAETVLLRGALTIDLWKKKQFSGLFHLNKGLSLQTIYYVASDKRQTLDFERQRAFQANLQSALAALDGNG